jgi:sulfofructose kinase
MSLQAEGVDVVCVGLASYDLVFQVGHHPGEDEKGLASKFLTCGGGPAANAAVAVSRLGLRSAFVGRLGRDEFGARHLQELVHEGVQTSGVTQDLAATPLSSILVKPDGKRTVVHYRGGEPAEDYARTDQTPPFDTKVVLTDGHQLGLSLPWIEYAAERGLETVLDAGSLHGGTEALFERVTYVVCSEQFAREYSGHSDETLALTALQGGSRVIVLTLGERGLIWAAPGGSGYVPAFPVDVRDSTGAGDAFHGAFAACLAWRFSWAETLRFASAVGALCCTKLGGRSGLPTYNEVQTFLVAHEG